MDQLVNPQWLHRLSLWFPIANLIKSKTKYLWWMGRPSLFKVENIDWPFPLQPMCILPISNIRWKKDEYKLQNFSTRKFLWSNTLILTLTIDAPDSVFGHAQEKNSSFRKSHYVWNFNYRVQLLMQFLYCCPYASGKGTIAFLIVIKYEVENFCSLFLFYF